MATYIGVADVNGDFTIPFSASYTGGQKVTVKSEKESAVKTIELFAPSEAISSGFVVASGNLNNFPDSIGVISLSGLLGNISTNAFYASNSNFFTKASGLIIESGPVSIGGNAFFGWSNATSLMIQSGITSIGTQSFRDWSLATALSLPATLITIGVSAFTGWVGLKNLVIPDNVETILGTAFYNCTSCLSVVISSKITNLGSNSFGKLTSCDQITVKNTTPPIIQPDTFSDLKPTCIFKVPASSVTAYQAAPNWSAFSSRIQAI